MKSQEKKPPASPQRFPRSRPYRGDPPEPIPPRDRDDSDDAVDEASKESFPASDPPGWTGTIARERPPKGGVEKKRK